MQYKWVILFPESHPSITPSIDDHLRLLQLSVDSRVRTEVSANAQTPAPVQTAGWGASVKSVSLSSSLTLSPDHLPRSCQLRVTRNWLYWSQGFICLSCSRPDRAARADLNVSISFRRCKILGTTKIQLSTPIKAISTCLLAQISKDLLGKELIIEGIPAFVFPHLQPISVLCPSLSQV